MMTVGGEEMVHTFLDEKGFTVTFTTDKQYFNEPSKHVLVICKWKGKWLLTRHKERGLEFPGGKLEKGETLHLAAIREVREETGAEVEKLTYIGNYRVNSDQGSFVKTVFFATLSHIHPLQQFHETDGYFLLDELPESFNGEQFSFIMKDQVIQQSLKIVQQITL
jgi:8-oxo-dGTP diphosphatase